MGWQTAYLAMSSLARISSDEALAALGESDRAEAHALASQLAHESRAVRAKALATELAKIARVIEDAELGATAPRDLTPA